MRVTTVLFDLDGTLLDTLEDLRDSVNYILQSRGFSPRSMEEVRASVGNGSARLLELSLPQGLATSDFDGILSDYTAYYLSHNQIKTAPYAGIHELLRKLASKEYKLGVVSNKPDASTKKLVRSFFGDVVSVAVGETPRVRRKPAPDSVKAALSELFSEPWESVYVGDSEVDIETARAAGLTCISAAWGFRTREQLLKAGASCIVDTPDEILKFV